MSNDQLASAARLMDVTLGYFYSAALRAVAVTGLADHADGQPRTAADLAAATGVSADGVARVLRLLATRGLFAEDDPGWFRLTAAGEPLRSDSPVSVRDMIVMQTDRSLWLPAGEMERCLAEGRSLTEDLLGQPFFDYFAQDPDLTAIFHNGMAAASAMENAPAATAYDFPDAGTVVDIGGGHGGFLAAVLRANPGLHGVLYDEAHVLTGHGLADQPDLDGRWACADGDFFTSVPSGDVLVLKRILHDWDDEQCARLLRTCRQALNPDGRILVIDTVIAPDNQPHQGKVLDLLLMVSMGGRERTEDDFRRLFADAGLQLVRTVATPAPVSIVEAAPIPS